MQLKQIQKENQVILRRLQEKEPFYSVDHWEKEEVYRNKLK